MQRRSTQVITVAQCKYALMQLRKESIKKILLAGIRARLDVTRRCYPIIDGKFLPQAGKSKPVVNFPEYSVSLVRKESATVDSR